MCGIVGVLAAAPVDSCAIMRMRDRLQHRGPDNAGAWSSDDGRVALGHRRLAVIDLAPEANQPFASHDARFRITFNGEIYNHRALRAELEREGVHFRTESDTEVLVECWRRWGPACLPRLSGMFAFALWDEVSRKLFCARDRAGEKPFHYAQANGAFVFGSELKALLEWPGIGRRISGPALIDFLSFGFIAEPRTVWEDCAKLPAGHWMEVRLPPDGPPVTGDPVCYWDLKFAPDHSVRDWGEPLREAIRAAADEMAVADVPLGTFLSGGVDSSAVTAALSRAGHSVRSFTIGFEEAGYDERPWARKVATLYGTEHHERVVSAADLHLPNGMDTLVTHFDEPFGDYSYLPTYLLCREARRSITVALSGDGGDELFAGYSRYKRVALREVADNVASHGLVRAATLGAGHLVPGARRRRALAQYAASEDDMLTDMLTLGLGVPQLQAGARGPAAMALRDYRPLDTVRALLARARPREVGLVNAMRYLDLKLTLAAGILVKVDRASMAVALEVRPVFLHHGLLSLAGRIPAGRLAGPRRAKHALKRALEPWLPDDVLYRKKMGFALPLPAWLRGNDVTPAATGSRVAEYLDPRFVERLRAEHTAGIADHTATLHNVGFLERWLQRWT